MEFNLIKIEIETVLGEDEEMDLRFFEYLDEYSIVYKLNESKGENGCPIVEYEGGPISLANMLREKFGMEKQDIQEIYPQLNEQR